MKPNENQWACALAFELVPAALFNFAVAFAVATVMRHNGLGDLAAGASVAAGIAAFLLAWRWLRRIGMRGSRLELPRFDSPPLNADSPGGDADASALRLVTEPGESAGEQQSAADELLLDDILQTIGPDSRVVRLFDPAAAPTAGELQSRIDRHLGSARPCTAPPDAAHELHEAIAALRQSLR